MRNIKRGEKSGKINLSDTFREEEVDLNSIGYPYIEVRSDGEYQILASKYSPANLIPVCESSGDHAFEWDYSAPAACRYLMIKLLTGTYLNATISVHSKNGNGN